MLIISSEINLALIWSANCGFNDSVGVGTLAITAAKFHVPVVTLYQLKIMQKYISQTHNYFVKTTNNCSNIGLKPKSWFFNRCEFSENK